MSPEQNIEVVGPSGYTDGRLNQDGRAMAAINALPTEIINPFPKPGDQELSVGDMEDLWREWQAQHGKRYKQEKHSAAQCGFEILRRQIETLARALTKVLTDAKVQDIQAGFYDEYVKMVAEHRAMRSFLLEHFPNHIQQAESANRKMGEVMREIMLGMKSPELPPVGEPSHG